MVRSITVVQMNSARSRPDGDISAHFMHVGGVASVERRQAFVCVTRRELAELVSALPEGDVPDELARPLGEVIAWLRSQ